MDKFETLAVALVAACKAFSVPVDEEAVRAGSAELLVRLRALKTFSQLPGEPYHSAEQLTSTSAHRLSRLTDSLGSQTL
jgi:hypothetical protein